MSEVLNHQQIKKKITRISFEIYERNLSAVGVVFAGISGMGMIMADLLAKELATISPLKIEKIDIKLDKKDVALSEIELSKEIDLTGKTLILVDDVLNTGKTLAYAMKPFLDKELKKMEIAVLVNRSHGLFPIRPDYTGYELATTFNDHILVDLSGDQYSVILH